MFSKGIKAVALMVCVAVGALSTPQTAKADLKADASYGFNLAGTTYVGGWVSNVGIFNYSQNQGRHVQLWFYYPTSNTWDMVMNLPVSDVPAGQTRAFHVPINPWTIPEQPMPVLYITPYFTDINPNNDYSFDTFWLGSY